MRASMSPAGTSAAAVAGSAVRSRSASPRAVATRASTGDAAPSLLPWLSRVTNDAGLESRVALADGPYGRSLVALRQLTPDEVIFNVPFSLVFAEDDSSVADARNALETSEANTHGDDDGLPWSALMAMRLLEARAGVDRPELKTWIDSLPSFVSTPPLEYSDEAIEACHDPVAIGEAKEVRAAHLEAAAALRKRLAFVGCDADDLRWAAGALHSRCFTHGPRGTHLAVPGVDMCNHCFENPTAQVRVVTSPDACQGAAATREIADAEHLENIDKSERFFQLRACEDGVEEGSEITISYGPWPNDPFFLYFGFVPNRNPNDTVALFADAAEIEACASRLGLIDTKKKAPPVSKSSGEETETDIGRSISSTAARRGMMLTREGIDPEILEVARLLGVSDWRPLVEGRCLELLRAFPTTLKEDRALLDGGGLTDDEAVAVRYRMSKKEVLLGPIAQARAREAAREAETK
jgi:hypothetical protein